MTDPIPAPDASDATLLDKFGRYRKSAAAFFGGVVLWGYVVVDSAPSGVTAKEWLGLGLVAALAAGVYGIPNEPTKPGA